MTQYQNVDRLIERAWLIAVQAVIKSQWDYELTALDIDTLRIYHEQGYGVIQSAVAMSSRFRKAMS